MTAFNYCLANFFWGEGIATTTKILATLDWEMAAYEALSVGLYVLLLMALRGSYYYHHSHFTDVRKEERFHNWPSVTQL